MHRLEPPGKEERLLRENERRYNGSFGKMAQKFYANGRIGSITCDSNFLMLLASNAQIGKVFTDVYILCNGWGYELWKMSMMAISFAGLHLMCLIELPPPQPQCIMGTIRETREHRKHTRNTQTHKHNQEESMADQHPRAKL